MSEYHYLYGFALADLDAARAAVEAALACKLEPHDSYFFGDYFKGVLPSGVELQLRRNDDPLYERNIDPPEERFAEPDHQGHAVLLEISGPVPDPDRARFDAIAGAALLRG